MDYQAVRVTVLCAWGLAVFMLFTSISLVVLSQRICLSSAAYLLFLCLAWADMTLFIISMFIDLLTSTLGWTSNPVGDFLGGADTAGFGYVEVAVMAWVALFFAIESAASTLVDEHCSTYPPHTHSRLANYLIRLAFRICVFFGMEKRDEYYRRHILHLSELLEEGADPENNLRPLVDEPKS